MFTVRSHTEGRFWLDSMVQDQDGLDLLLGALTVEAPEATTTVTNLRTWEKVTYYPQGAWRPQEATGDHEVTLEALEGPEAPEEVVGV